MAGIRWRNSGFRKLRKLPTVKALLEDRAEAGVDAAGRGDGFIAYSEQHRNRARAAVVAASRHARHLDAEEHTLLRVIDDMRF